MQYNIFQNDFYESRPGIPWAYRLTALYGPFPESTVIITKAIKEAHLPEMELKAIQVFFGGADKYVPTRYQNYGTFSLTFNEDCKLRAYKSLLGLFRRSFDNREDIAIPGPDQPMRHYKYSNLYADLTFVLEILDPKNINLQDTNVKREQFGLGREYNDMRVVAKYVFGECYVEKIDDLDLDYSSEEIIEWGMTVAFNSIKVTYPKRRGLILDFEDTFQETEFEAYDNFEAYSKKTSIGGGGGLSNIANEGIAAFDRAQKERSGIIGATKLFGTESGKVDAEGKPKENSEERTEDQNYPNPYTAELHELLSSSNGVFTEENIGLANSILKDLYDSDPIEYNRVQLWLRDNGLARIGGSGEEEFERATGQKIEIIGRVDRSDE